MKQGTTANYRLEQVATALAATVAAALCGWACALAAGLWGDAQTARLPAWRPFALQAPTLDGAAPAAQAATLAAMKLAGVAGDRAYFVGAANVATRGLSLAVGESLPSGCGATRKRPGCPPGDRLLCRLRRSMVLRLRLKL